MTAMAYGKYNLHPNAPIGSDQSGAANGAITGREANVGQAFHPDNPMMWLVGLGAITLGLIGFSTHVRVAGVRAGLDAGKA